ncbi:MAG: AAA-like domain-containing protein [Chloroflexi bacterium]|nr:AAA-like domain-containing protein [Chloroflexota bacterium]
MAELYHLKNIRALLTEGFSDGELRDFCYDEPKFKLVHESLAQATGKAEIVRLMIKHANQHLLFEILLAWAKERNSERYEQHQPYHHPPQPAHIFICYKRHVEPDQKLAVYLHQFLTDQGHQIFIDQTLRTGDAWLEQKSADSEMVQAEVSRAYEYRKVQGRPQVLPVRLAYEGLLPYTIAAFLSPQQYVAWHSEADNERVAHDILAAIEGRLPLQTPIPTKPMMNVISEDGRPIVETEALQPPLPEFDPRFLAELPAPGGAVKLRDTLYVEREADGQLKRELTKWGSTTTIRASRQMGKTSLLMRGLHQARQEGTKVISLDFQGFGHDQLASPDVFLHELAKLICHELRLDDTEVDKLWQGSLGAPNKLTFFLEDYVLPRFEGPLIMAMDEADYLLLRTPFYQDFFGLVRSWHNRRSREAWEKFNLVLVISTEPYLLIDDVSQSPFNVGLKLELADFSEAQVHDLNRRHGSPVAEPHLPPFMTLLNGHPYLTRKALYTLVTERVTWPDLLQVAASEQGPFGDHLRRHQWGLRDKPQLREALAQVIRSNRCSDELALFRLLRAGLIKGSGDVYTCRCDLYRLYFKDKL